MIKTLDKVEWPARRASAVFDKCIAVDVHETASNGITAWTADELLKSLCLHWPKRC
jgi:hypothetical protein